MFDFMQDLDNDIRDAQKKQQERNNRKTKVLNNK